MTEKNKNNRSKGEPSDHQDEMEIPPNCKLLYRNTSNPERDKSSGLSSDEETTSSSLAPIPDSLKQLRNKPKWIVGDAREHSEIESAYNGVGDLEKSSGNLMNSLEEIRRKYTLKNESSVVLKVNSANMMLDDILNCANLNKTTVDNNKFIKKEEFRVRNDTESETSTTETSISHPQPCAYITDHCHPHIPIEFYNSLCPRHCNAVQYSNKFEEKIEEPPVQNKRLQDQQRKKSLREKFQDLQIGLKIQSAYKAFQKTRGPFTKTRKDFDGNIDLGIPGAGCQGDNATQTQRVICKNEHHNIMLHQFTKKLHLDLVESSETSQSDTKFTDREDCHSTCLNQIKCKCPEVIPQCFCVQHIQVTETSKQNSPKSPVSPIIHNNENGGRIQFPTFHLNDLHEIKNQNQNYPNRLSQISEKDEDDKDPKSSPRPKKYSGWKHCRKEKNLIERTDIYYFDHGNSAYYQTTDRHPMRYTECLVERTDEYATKFWAEFFGTIEIGIAFIISFLLQLYRFLFTSIIRSLTVGLLQIFSDYFFKPLLTILFNGIIQPCLILVYNIATSVRDLCFPISEVFGFFAKEVANILRSCRLVEISRDAKSSCNCENKV